MPQANPETIPELSRNTSNRSDKPITAQLKPAVRMLKRGASMIPTLGAAIDVLVECFDNISFTSEMAHEFEELTLHIAANLRSLEGHMNDHNSTDMNELIANAVEELTKEAQHMNKTQTHVGSKRLREADEYAEVVMRSYRRLDSLFQTLNSTAIMSVWKIANDSQADTLLRNLNPAKEARYNSNAASRVKRNGCTPNTRQHLLVELQTWAEDPRGARIYWMNGMAGTGKTTIAYSFCDQLDSSNQLAASFFCSRSLPDCRNVTRITPTIAYQLARVYAPFRDSLCQVLRRDPDIADLEVAAQFEKLLSDPMQLIVNRIHGMHFVVVIDALDECSDQGDPLRILEALLRFADSLPIKFFVTCRPEGSVLDELASSLSRNQSMCHLHDIAHSLVQADIETYLRVELAPIGATESQIKSLAQKAGRLFIFAATLARYVGTKNASINSKRRLDVLLGIKHGSTSKAYEALDKLYDMILSAAFDNDQLEQSDKDNVKLVLNAVLCAREPLTVEALGKFLQLESFEDARFSIEPLRALLHINEESGVVTVLHASFLEYMQAESRSGRFYYDATYLNQLFAQKCFDLMKRLLRFNICRLESSFIPDAETPAISSRIQEEIPLHLYYASRYWAEHTIAAGTCDWLRIELDTFFRQHFLFWLEVMSLRDVVQTGVELLSRLCSWMKKLGTRDNLSECRDALRFATTVAGIPGSQSTPHIYISVLPLWDKNAPIWRFYGTRMKGLVNVTRHSSEVLSRPRHAYNDSFPMIASPNGHMIANGTYGGLSIKQVPSCRELLRIPTPAASMIRCLAFSPDGSYLASGLSDHTICIWDLITGHLVGSAMEGHATSVRSVCYSSDGKLLVSGSVDCSIRIWNTVSGQQVLAVLDAHKSRVNSLACSPDGKCIVSGSDDRMVCVWDLHTGKLLFGPLMGHIDAVRCVVYSPDGSHIASGSADQTIRIWGAHSGATFGKPFEGHSGRVLAVSYSPDGRRILSGSNDNTVRVWDSQTGQTVAVYSRYKPPSPPVYILDGNQILYTGYSYSIHIVDVEARDTASTTTKKHSDPVFSAAFSTDGSRIVSSGESGAISVWDSTSGARIAGPFTGHTNNVWSVGFSPCGKRIVSGSSDGSIRIWDAKSGRWQGDPYVGHRDTVFSVAFSPDGNRVASGSRDHTIRIWDIKLGSSVVEPLQGHTGTVWSIAFSAGGEYLGSSSDDNTVRIWDTATGRKIGDPFQGGKYAVAYSPDGAQIASDFDGFAVVIRDIHTGDIVTGPCEGHKDVIRCVAFSPDGLFVASGSNDHSIRIWHSQTGDAVACLPEAHPRRLSSVTFAPDGSILASSSFDGSIRLWSTKTLTLPVRHDSWWVVDTDGWIVREDGTRMLWIPYELRATLKWPQNTVVIHPHGEWKLDLRGLYMGTEWANCYKPN
ncbi:Vegetative incompatibility protein HET-E-1 [Ceratobasidium sp. AG-Ba]|nr:Vegetative incompatibility protein HET-E-1 [Ceratobasidium sp. AG-Ba]